MLENFEQIKSLIVEATGIEEEKVTPEASLQDDIELDSLNAVELSMSLEKEFDITIEDEELINCKTVKDLCELITKAKAKN